MGKWLPRPKAPKAQTGKYLPMAAPAMDGDANCTGTGGRATFSSKPYPGDPGQNHLWIAAQDADPTGLRR